MPSSFTTGKMHLEKPSNGSDVDTWDVPLNANADLIDKCVSGAVSISMSNATVTLSQSQMQSATIGVNGTLSANVQLNLASGIPGIYLINNVTTGNFTLTVATPSPGATAVLPQSSGTFVLTDGTSVFIADTGAIQSVVSSQYVPPGMVADFAMSTPPTGWLFCDGSAVSRTTYAALFANLSTTWGAGNGSTTFNLPDFRGRFRRGWDSGGGVDPARAFASLQADAFKAHNHGVNDPGHTHNFQETFLAQNANSALIPNAGGTTTVTTSSSTTGITIQNTGGIETRPTNYAVLTCIKT